MRLPVANELLLVDAATVGGHSPTLMPFPTPSSAFGGCFGGGPGAAAQVAAHFQAAKR